MKTVVTGATGMTGSFLVERLLARGDQVRVAARTDDRGWLADKEVEWHVGDLADQAFCATVVEGVDHVFHLASERRNVDYHHAHAETVLSANLQMTQALIGAMETVGFPAVTFVSTANIQPDMRLEQMAASDQPDGYILGKLHCEAAWQAAADQQHFPLLIVRPVNIYGPRDRFAADGNVIPALVVKAKQSTDQLEIWGSGQQERSFLYVEDVAQAVLTLVEAKVQGTEYLWPSEPVTIAVLAEKVRDLVHPDLPLHFDITKPEGAKSVSLPSVHDCLREFPWTNVDEGLEMTVEWWRQST